jgi:hypothetical protein
MEPYAEKRLCCNKQEKVRMDRNSHQHGSRKHADAPAHALSCCSYNRGFESYFANSQAVQQPEGRVAVSASEY